ncbi:acyl-CoA thioester hydrolase YciA [Orbaceae bacterium ESL0721]|nr:acyl-CoA thioester hydrolase YciA [Orbaceae bacterium ESL0721]
MNRESNTPKGQLTLRTLAMPTDTNPHGYIFGGWIMSQMDLGGSILAQEIAKKRVVTVNASSITFHQPAMVGDVVCCYARCLKTGVTSITVEIEIWIKRAAESSAGSQRSRITDAIFTYVAVDKYNKPKALPKEHQHYDWTKSDMLNLNNL